MKKVFISLVLIVLSFFTYRYFQLIKTQKVELNESTALIEKSIKNVSKLVVTEAQFSEVFNYKNSKELFGSFVTSEKKALVVVNAEVQVAYDLSLIEFNLDKESKTLTILSIPKAELKIFPEFEYYDVQDDYFNEFEASDYNDIKDRINIKLKSKIHASDIEENAKERFLTEVSQFYILTNSLGWKLVYKENEIIDFNGFDILD